MLLTTSCLTLLLCLAPPTPDDELYKVPKRKFELPLKVDPDRKDEITEIQLFVSWDRGKKWEKVKSVDVTAISIPYTAPRDGEAWFVVRVIDNKGIADPTDLAKASSIQKILIQTKERMEAKKPPEPRDKVPEGTLKKRIAELEARVKELEGRLKELETRSSKDRR
jgi:hypothetical protein